MKDNNLRYFILFFSLVALLVILVLLLATKKPSPADIRNRPVVLTDYDNNNVTLRLTIDGRPQALENHKAFRISIGRGLRTLEVFKGYNQDIQISKDYGNQQNAFEVLTRSLQRAGFTTTTKDKLTLAQKDERGVCVSGYRYIYEVIDNDQQVLRSWSTSCSPLQGTFEGNNIAVRQLFRDQIPDFEQVTNGIQL